MTDADDVPCNNAEKMPCCMLGIATAIGGVFGSVDEHAYWIWKTRNVK
jgi:hypothetical protein